MTDGEALLKAVLANPDDDTPRLLFADWLQENGDEERAEFIRVQVGYARLHLHAEECKASSCEQCARCGHLSDLLLGRLKVPRQGPTTFNDDPWRIMGLKDNSGPRIEWDWHRGFVSDFRIPAGRWLEHADAITARHPVTRVTLTSLWDPQIDALYALVRTRKPEVWWKLERGGWLLTVPTMLTALWPQVAFTLPSGR